MSWRVFTFFIAIVGVDGLYSQTIDHDDAVTKVDTAIATAISAYKTSSGVPQLNIKLNDAKKQLEKLPAEVVIPAVINMLQDDRVIIRRRLQSMAYDVLHYHAKAVGTEAGFAEFMRGLNVHYNGAADERSVAQTCIQILGNCPNNKRGEVVQRFDEMLKDDELPLHRKKSILQQLLRWKDSDLIVLDRILSVCKRLLNDHVVDEGLKVSIVKGICRHGKLLGWGAQGQRA